MSTFKPLQKILNALSELKSASTGKIIAHLKIVSQKEKTSITQGVWNARHAGFIESKLDEKSKETLYSLTTMGIDKLAGKEIKLSKPAESITQADIDKAIRTIGGVKKPSNPTTSPIAKSDDYGAMFNTDGKLIIWNGHDEVVFEPTVAAKVIAFVVNQMPWVEFCKKNSANNSM